MKTLNALLIAAAFATSSAAFAGNVGNGPQGFDQPNIDTVAAVSKNARDDQFVCLHGRLINYLGHEHYEFADNTGTIEVELDEDRDWFFISKGELIEIVGKVDRDFFSTTIEVKRAHSLEREAVPYTLTPGGFDKDGHVVVGK